MSKKKKKNVNYHKDYQENKRNNIVQNNNTNIEQNKKTENVNNRKKKKHPIANFFLFLTLISSLAYFGINLIIAQNNVNFFSSLISNLILVVFSILFISICITNPNRKKGTIILGSFFLLLFNSFGILTSLKIINIPSIGYVKNFTGKSLTEVVRWASKNNVTLTQDYEYCDMISSYNIISQDIQEGTKIKDINELKIAISEGPNPDKEIIIPNMIDWNSEKVLQYVTENALNNVEVEFIESDKTKDTVIEQSKSGSMKRSEEIKLTFSLGEKLDNTDIKLIDLTNKTEFEAIFYLKQHRIQYEIKRDFSNKIERGNVSKQSKKAGNMIKVNNAEEKVTITISKGKSIKVPNLKKMSIVEITEWIIENKLKLEFSNQYDDTIKENKVIEANYKTGDIIEQGTTIQVVISKGNLIMKDFKSLDEFRDWGNKYNIAYQETHEFKEEIAQGEIISYSYKKGDIIKNNDTIIVTISDGKEYKVPNLIGMSKKSIIAKLEDLGLNYNFVYQSSNKYTKDKAIKQSISAGSKVTKGTTITITLSNGKETEYREEEPNSTNNSSNNNNNQNSGNATEKPKPPTPTCSPKTYTIGRELNNIFRNYTGYSAVESALYSYFSSNYPNVKITVIGVDGGDATSGSYIDGIGPGSQITSCNETAYKIEIAK